MKLWACEIMGLNSISDSEIPIMGKCLLVIVKPIVFCLTQSCREAEFAENFQLSVSAIFDANCTKVFR